MVVACCTDVGTCVRRRRPLPRVYGTRVTRAVVLRRSDDTTCGARRGEDLARRTESTCRHVIACNVPSARLVLMNGTERACSVVRARFRHASGSGTGGGESLPWRARACRCHLNAVVVIDTRLVFSSGARLTSPVVCRATEAVRGRCRVGVVPPTLRTSASGHI